jgi:hypothetical protein
MATRNASGMVKMLRIGSSAGKVAKYRYDKIYATPSTTARQSACDDGRIILNRLKIQSIPLWKLRGSRGKQGNYWYCI